MTGKQILPDCLEVAASWQPDADPTAAIAAWVCQMRSAAFARWDPLRCLAISLVPHNDCRSAASCAAVQETLRVCLRAQSFFSIGLRLLYLFIPLVGWDVTDWATASGTY